MKKWLLAVIPVLVVVLGAWFVVPAPLKRDAPRQLPWVLPDYRQASVHWYVDDYGRIRNEVEHLFLRDISPQMVAWFYRQLPISTIDYAGTRYPLYHIFHPTEHGRIRVLDPAENGVAGMGRGAMIMREEWFGPYDSRGRARLRSFSDQGMLAVPQFAGLNMGRVEHHWQAEAGGTRYRVDAIIGVDWPLLGPLVNLAIRTWVFHPQFMAQWQRHQVEEVGSLQFFLPALYAQRDRGNHFQLEAEGGVRR